MLVTIHQSTQRGLVVLVLAVCSILLHLNWMIIAYSFPLQKYIQEKIFEYSAIKFVGALQWSSAFY